MVWLKRRENQMAVEAKVPVIVTRDVPPLAGDEK
jgi:hypothetical protein